MADPVVGGSFAPPVTKELLGKYRAVADGAGDEAVAEAMLRLADMLGAFLTLPKSQRAVVGPHPTGVATIVRLDEKAVDALWDHVPWPYELEAYGRLFDGIPAAQKELRDAAFHLLWYGVELEKDREPLTTDRLQLPK